VKDEPWIKVGKTNNLKRTKDLIRMGYGGRDDWEHIATFPTISNHDANALEGLVIAELANKNLRLRRLSWVNLINGKDSYADECFRCSPESAIETAIRMSWVINKYLE
jgi:hypothetical protein